MSYWFIDIQGLTLGALLLISGLTGSAIVFNKPIDGWLNSDLLKVVPRAGRASLDEVLTNVRHAAGCRYGARSMVSGHSIARLCGSFFWEMARHKEFDRLALMGFLVDLHMRLLSGEKGEKIIG